MGTGLDTVSVQEVQLGIKAGFDPKKIIFTPNGVSMEEIEEVASLGVQINMIIFQFWNSLDLNILRSQFVFE